MKRISFEEFRGRFRPRRNHLVADASFDGALFETFGAELAHVTDQPDELVWTYVDGDGGELFLVAGFHVVNRIGYLVCGAPHDGSTYVDLDL